MKRFLCLCIIITFIYPENKVDESKISPIVAYWKTLSKQEKEIFLFSYLTQIYDTQEQLKKEIGYGGFTKWHYENRAELVYGIFDQLEVAELGEFAGWIDEFYSHEEYFDRPFHEALSFSFRFQQAAGETIWEKYENLKFGRIKPGD